MYTSVYQNEERFGFSTRGTFFAPKETEMFRFIIAVVILFMVLFSLYSFNLENVEFLYNIQGRLEHLPFFGLAQMFFTVIPVIITVVYIKVMLRGTEMNFSANEAMFSFWSEKGNIKKTDIQYNDVVAVSYEPKKLFGFIDRGLTVTIITHSLGNVTVGYLYPRGTVGKTPENTPFHIIEERVDIYGKKTASP